MISDTDLALLFWDMDDAPALAMNEPNIILRLNRMFMNIIFI